MLVGWWGGAWIVVLNSVLSLLLGSGQERGKGQRHTAEASGDRWSSHFGSFPKFSSINSFSCHLWKWYLMKFREIWSWKTKSLIAGFYHSVSGDLGPLVRLRSSCLLAYQGACSVSGTWFCDHFQLSERDMVQARRTQQSPPESQIWISKLGGPAYGSFKICLGFHHLGPCDELRDEWMKVTIDKVGCIPTGLPTVKPSIS